MRFSPIRTDVIRVYQSGRPDTNGQVPGRQMSGGDGNPCRQCLQMIPKGRKCWCWPTALSPRRNPMPNSGQSSCALTPTKLGR